MKNYVLILFIGFFNLFSCNLTSQEAITIYRTPEFIVLEKEFTYSVSDAAEITAEFIHQEQPDKSSFWLKMDIIYEDYYLFKDEPSNYSLKHAKYDLSGVWFNAKTGEIKRVKNAKSVDLVLEPSKNFPFTKEFIFE